MAVGNFIFFLLTTLVAAHLIFAESQQQPSQAGNNQDAPPQGGQNQGPSERFFGRFASCNYTATPGATCLSCTTAQSCLPSNVGVVRFCHGFLPYCNAGRCTFIAPTNCTASG